jgi:acetate kinase
MNPEDVIIQGMVDRIGLRDSEHIYQEGFDGSQMVRQVSAPDHGAALDEILNTLSVTLGSMDQLTAVAHRIGHGGKYKKAALIDDEVIEEIDRMTFAVPLHHPAMLAEIKESLIRIPKALHVAVFDTTFHSTMADAQTIYGLPFKYFEKGYKRTGFHGHSHKYISEIAGQFLGKPLAQLKLVTCHLGNGCSITAIDGGKSVDTTLGMTSVEGLIMGTRAGDVDPGLIPMIMKEDGISPDELTNLLYKDSGLAAISGISRDMREIEVAAQTGDWRAQLALEAFCHRVKRYIGAMMMVLNGCDAIVFAGGIGRNSSTVRSKVLGNAERLGIVLDEEKNMSGPKPEFHNPAVAVSAADSKIKVLVVQTFEELMMARECKELVMQ